MKKLLSVLLAVCMVLSMMTVAITTVGAYSIVNYEVTSLKLKPSDEWLTDGARFAAYFFGDSGDYWDDMTEEADGCYSVAIPEGFDRVIFCRMNPEMPANNFDNKWNQTQDLMIYSGMGRVYVVEGWDGGEWQTPEYPAQETTAFIPPQPPTEEPTEEPVSGDVFIVAGSEEDIFGTSWDGGNEANLMTLNADGVYSKEYSVDKAYKNVQLKVVKNGAEWIGDSVGQNITFNLTGAGSFTVVYDPMDNSVSVMGEIVQEITSFEYESVFAVGNGGSFEDDGWLNGVSWDPTAEENRMTMVAQDIWEITFENVNEDFGRQIKFTIDGAWTHNFGGTFEESGVASAAAYNGDNITFDTDDICTVKAQLDLSNFDFATKQGAVFTITIEYDEPGEVVYGDADGDGKVTIDDVTAIQRMLAEQEGFILEPGTDKFTAADVDGDGSITVQDATLIQQYLAELIEKFPVEEQPV